MEANISNRSNVFEPYFPPITQHPQFKEFLRRCVESVRSINLHPSSFEEDYLALAQNDADLERRLLEVQRWSESHSIL